MATVNDIWVHINAFAPFNTQLEFDNAGLLVGDPNAVVDSALLALDITPAVVEEAKARGCALLISHHPVLFHPMKTLLKDTLPFMLAANGISAICAHTNLDMAVGGVNDELCRSIGIECASIPQENAVFRVGVLPQKISATGFAKMVADALHATVRLNMPEKTVEKIAVCSGAGSEFWEAAKNAGADLLLTGEAKHHEYLAADACGFSIAVAGHFETEQIIIPALEKRLSGAFPETVFLVSEQKNPVLTVI